MFLESIYIFLNRLFSNCRGVSKSTDTLLIDKNRLRERYKSKGVINFLLIYSLKRLLETQSSSRHLSVSTNIY